MQETMPPKNSNLGQQTLKMPIQNTTSNATANISNVANEDENEASARSPSISDLRGSIHSLKEDFTKQCRHAGSN